MTKKAEIITFGCRLNIYESEILKQGIKEHKVIDTAIFKKILLFRVPPEY